MVIVGVFRARVNTTPRFGFADGVLRHSWSDLGRCSLRRKGFIARQNQRRGWGTLRSDDPRVVEELVYAGEVCFVFGSFALLENATWHAGTGWGLGVILGVTMATQDNNKLRLGECILSQLFHS